MSQVVKKAVQQASVAKKGQNRKVAVSRSIVQNGSVRAKFLQDLLDPFSPTTLGCRVPDPYSYPTVTFHLHGNIQSNNSASGSLVFLPNPVVSMIDIKASISAGTSVGAASAMQKFTNNPQLWKATEPSFLYDNMSSYRVVSWGIKVSNNQPEMTATGRFIFYPVSCTDTVPSFDALTSTPMSLAAAGDTTCPLFLGQPGAYLNTAAILNIPGAFQVTVQDMFRGDVLLCGTPVTPDFWDFKATFGANKYSDTYSIGDTAVSSNALGTIAASNAGFKDVTRCRGGVAIGVFWEGASSTPQTVNIEYIYHLEGQALSSANNYPAPSDQRDRVIGTTNDLELAMSVSGFEEAARWVETGATFLSKAMKNPAIRRLGKGLTTLMV